MKKLWPSIKNKFNRRAKSLSFRFSNAADLKTVLKFYKENRHGDVDIRSRPATEKAVKDGHFILMFDENGKMYGGSAVYDYEFDGHDRKWVEIGTTQTKGNGLALPKNDICEKDILYPYIISAQVINEFLTKTPEDRFFATVNASNSTVRYFLGDLVGWNKFTPTSGLEAALKTTKDWHNPDPRVWLGADSTTLPHQARLVLKLIETKELINKKTGEKIQLDLSDFPLANELLPYVKVLASGKFAEFLEKHPHIGLEQVRNYLEYSVDGKKYPNMPLNIFVRPFKNPKCPKL